MPKEKISLKEVYPDQVKKYWNKKRNDELGIYPSQVTKKSEKKAWFKCPIDGHEWERNIHAITNSWDNGNSGCPACKGLIATENNSLLSLYPDQVDTYWNYEKNNELGIYPNKVTKGSNQQAWFKCPIDGCEWQTNIYHITRSWNKGNSGCPACKGLVVTANNSLLSLYPDQVDTYWNKGKNDELKIYLDQVTKKSDREAWFKCPIDGYQWQVSIDRVTRSWDKGNSGCAVCSGKAVTASNSLLSLCPDQVDKYWNYEKNDQVICPDQVSRKSKDKAWFKCPIDGYEWEATMYAITRSWDKGNSGCDCCFRKEGYIYLIKEVSSQKCKIGMSKHPTKRLKEVGGGRKLELVVYIGCFRPRWGEILLHEYFKKYWLQGEWFELPDDCIKNFVSIVYKLDSKNNFINTQLQLI